MPSSPRLNLPLLAPAQALKHITHNEAIIALDSLVQLAVLSADLNEPPATPESGDRYIVGPAPIGDWSGQALSVAIWDDGYWRFFSPKEGWLCWIVNVQALHIWTGSEWAEIEGAGGGEIPESFNTLGVNATADETNRLSVSSEATLFNHSGAGHQIKLNKNLVGDTASVLFQTNFSGRAEYGLTGDDDFRLKVSANGSSWTDAVTIDSATGNASFKTGIQSHTLNIGGDRTIAFSGGAASIVSGGQMMSLNDGGTINLRSTNVRVNSFDAGAMLNLKASQSLKVPLIIRAAEAQVADLLRLQDDSGQSLFEIDRTGDLAVTDDIGDAPTSVLRLYHNSTTSVAPGNGCAILFQADNSGNSKQALGSVLMEATDVNGYLSADFVVRLHNDAITSDEVMRVTSDGNMGIGTDMPQARLDVSGAIRPGSYQIATAPTPSSQGAGAMIFVTDTINGGRLVYSDGTDWRFLSDDTVMS